MAHFPCRTFYDVTNGQTPNNSESTFFIAKNLHYASILYRVKLNIVLVLIIKDIYNINKISSKKNIPFLFR